MFGTNKKRKPIFGNGDFLDVEKIFRTIQCEGPYAGIPAIFVRLGGCNLACNFCDTDFESFTKQSLKDILNHITNLSRDGVSKYIDLVVISGGEPMRQPISMLCNELIDRNFKVQIETNGTLSRKIPLNVDVICSPKIVNKKYTSINKNLLQNIRALKFLISSNLCGYNDIDAINSIVNNFEEQIEVFLQPMDQYNAALNLENKRLTVEFAIKYGYRISYQIHKELCIE